MIIPVRCFTCGKVMADKYDYYMQQVHLLESKSTNTKPAGLAGDEVEAKAAHFDTLHTGKILDDMGLTRYCCRRHMLTTVDMMEVI